MIFILYQSCTRQVNKNLVLLEVLGQTMFAGFGLEMCTIEGKGFAAPSLQGNTLSG